MKRTKAHASNLSGAVSDFFFFTVEGRHFGESEALIFSKLVC